MQTQVKISTLKSDLRSRLGECSIPDYFHREIDSRQSSGITEVDRFLFGGLPKNGVTEIGAPFGKEGRQLLLKFIVKATSPGHATPLWVLWISCQDEISLYPPALFATGINPQRVLFTRSSQPLKDLNRVFMNPFFKLIVLDSPHGIRQSGHSFLSARARANGQSIILLRNFFLSNSNGNIWARFRFNCWKQPGSRSFCLKGVKGTAQKSLMVQEGMQ